MYTRNQLICRDNVDLVSSPICAQTQRPDLVEEECVTPPAKRTALCEDALLDLGAGDTPFDSRGRILPRHRPPPSPPSPGGQQHLPAGGQQQQQQQQQRVSPPCDVPQSSISALLAQWGEGGSSQQPVIPEISPFKEVTQARPRQPDLPSPGYFADDVSPASFMRLLGSSGGRGSAGQAARSGLIDAINAARSVDELPQLAPRPATPEELIKSCYSGQRYPDILQAPDDLLREVGELGGSTNVYLYLAPEEDMLSLVNGFYSMDYRWNAKGMFKLNNAECGKKKSFFVNPIKRKLLTGAMDNHTLLLPMHEPVNACTPAWYRERMRNNLVLLCCHDTHSRTFEAINCVALGMFVGDQLYTNTLDKTTRFQGRPDDLKNTMLPVDNNQVLAPVHIITTLFRDTPVTLAGVLEGPPGMLLPFAYSNTLPYPLELAVADIQAATTTPTPEAWTSRFMEHIMAKVITKLLEYEKDHRNTAVDDSDRMHLVTRVLDLVTGQLDTDLINTPIAQSNRAEKLAPKDKKRGKDKFDLKTVLRRAAANVQNSRLHPAEHYATLAALHASM